MQANFGHKPINCTMPKIKLLTCGRLKQATSKEPSCKPSSPVLPTWRIKFPSKSVTTYSNRNNTIKAYRILLNNGYEIMFKRISYNDQKLL